MQTVNCKVHNNSIIIFEPDELYMYSDKIEATIIFYDSLGKKYLKKYTSGQCDENCEMVKNLLKE